MTSEVPLNRQTPIRLKPINGILLLAALFMLPILLPDRANAQGADENAVTDPLQLLKSLEERRMDLDKREEVLAIREQDMARLEEKLNSRIAALEKLRNAIQFDLAKEKEINTANIARLAKIYGSMKVKAAAEGLQNMDQETAVKIFKVMPEKVAAKILGKMKGPNATALANEMGMSIAEKRRRRQ